MKHFMAVVIVLLSTPSLAGVITYDFTRLVLGSGSQQTSLTGQITFDEDETNFNMNTWLSFFFQLEFDGVTYDIFEQDIAFFEISDLNDGIYGNDENEGFELFITDTNSTNEFSIYSGFAALNAEDSCVYDLNGDGRCSGSLFQLVKTGGANNGSTQVSEPAFLGTAMLMLFVFASMRKRKQFPFLS
ncbi:hypothetical protein EYR97_14985 [Alteromonas sp. KUL42]|uniref:hypothetical protein n=2 Tax=Alteromonas sp. KUL42 TaxID=2480797 RepID=UPI0007959443|nr:hypothetical protein [Alteromonas sp. KUL42]KXJ59630.1 MAG: hypothetical protein AXW14_15110 [Alteromonas sp. Nap_26]TAP33554.1 hypothetical protein EYR97_14985 [Alteromonas sp. KUL42]